MPLNFTLSEELISWVQEYGDWRTPASGVKYKGIDKHKRTELLVILLSNLKELGAPKSYFSESATRSAIAEACTGPKAALGVTRYNKSKNIAFASLEVAINTVFMKDSDYFKKYGKMPEKKKEENDGPTEEERIAKAVNDEAEELAKQAKASAPRQTEEVPLVFEEFKPSGKSEMPTTVRNTDPEMDKFLGFKDE